MVQEEPATIGERFHVAIFEDLEAARKEYQELFARHGVRLKFYDSPIVNREIIEDLTRFAPHLLIVDLVLGQSRYDGVELLKKLHREGSIRDTPVVVCSKLVSDEAGADIRRLEAMPGVAAVLPKTPRYPSADDFLRHATSPPDSLQPQPLVR
jgi:CheY-like chemotaxis protein